VIAHGRTAGRERQPQAEHHEAAHGVVPVPQLIDTLDDDDGGVFTFTTGAANGVPPVVVVVVVVVGVPPPPLPPLVGALASNLCSSGVVVVGVPPSNLCSSVVVVVGALASFRSLEQALVTIDGVEPHVGHDPPELFTSPPSPPQPSRLSAPMRARLQSFMA
jgi:hypothetical protein